TIPLLFLYGFDYLTSLATFISSYFFALRTFTLLFGLANNTPVTITESPGLIPFSTSTRLASLTPVLIFTKVDSPFFTNITWLFLSSGIIQLAGTLTDDLCLPASIKTFAKAPGLILAPWSNALTFKLRVSVLAPGSVATIIALPLSFDSASSSTSTVAPIFIA